jgi:O-antigen ligase
MAVMTVVVVSSGVASPNTRSVFLSRTEGGLDRATSNRAGLIYNGLQVAVRHPFFGVGVGGFRHAYAGLTHLKGKEPKKAASHDTPVTFAVEGGVVGLSLYLWLLGALFTALFRRLGNTFESPVVLTITLGFAAVVVHSLFYDNFFSDPTTWGLIGLAGLTISTVKRHRAGPVEPVAAEFPLSLLLRPSRQVTDRARTAEPV